MTGNKNGRAGARPWTTDKTALMALGLSITQPNGQGNAVRA